MKSDELFAALGSAYPSAHGWMLVPQVRNATGFGANRTADALAMNGWPSRGLEVHGFEMKVSRGDWLRELKKPAKAETIFGYCDRWWIVVPGLPAMGDKFVVGPGELPSSWGLIVISGGKVEIATKAPKLKPKPLDRAFLAAVVRRLAACATPEAQKAQSFENGRKLGHEEGRRDALARMERRGHREEVRWQRESLERLEEIADRCLKGIRKELSKLKDEQPPELDDDIGLPTPPEASPS